MAFRLSIARTRSIKISRAIREERKVPTRLSVSRAGENERERATILWRAAFYIDTPDERAGPLVLLHGESRRVRTPKRK